MQGCTQRKLGSHRARINDRDGAAEGVPLSGGLPELLEVQATSFGAMLRALRRRLDCKQLVLSRAIGCSEAALSLWESGARFPTARSLARILVAFAEGGASPVDLLELRAMWHRAGVRRAITQGMTAPSPGAREY